MTGEVAFGMTGEVAFGMTGGVVFRKWTTTLERALETGIKVL
jgi:hypothetical protein